MAMQYNDALEQIAETDMWLDAGKVAGGYLGAELLGGTIDGMVVDLPNEVYGLAAIGANEAFYGDSMLTIGAGLHTVDALAQRLDVKDSITELA